MHIKCRLVSSLYIGANVFHANIKLTILILYKYSLVKYRLNLCIKYSDKTVLIQQNAKLIDFIHVINLFFFLIFRKG